MIIRHHPIVGLRSSSARLLKEGMQERPADYSPGLCPGLCAH